MHSTPDAAQLRTLVGQAAAGQLTTRVVDVLPLQEAADASEEYLARVRPDEHTFLDLGAGDVSVTAEHVVHAGAAPR